MRRFHARKYLDRIKYHGHIDNNALVLKRLQLRHLESVPFENLDIHTGKQIRLNRYAFYRKIVEAGRGGFCYELNGAFSLLLESLGFKVTILSAEVAKKNGGFSPNYDHMALLVQLGHPWLVDVGFGESFATPKRLDVYVPQSDNNGKSYLIRRKYNDEYYLVSRRDKPDGVWIPQYRFTMKPRKLSEFNSRCEWQQKSKKSHFRKGPMITQLRSDGRITLTDKKFIRTKNGRRVEYPVRDSTQFKQLLNTHFGIAFNPVGEILSVGRIINR